MNVQTARCGGRVGVPPRIHRARRCAVEGIEAILIRRWRSASRRDVLQQLLYRVDAAASVIDAGSRTSRSGAGSTPRAGRARFQPLRDPLARLDAYLAPGIRSRTGAGRARAQARGADRSARGLEVGRSPGVPQTWRHVAAIREVRSMRGRGDCCWGRSRAWGSRSDAGACGGGAVSAATRPDGKAIFTDDKSCVAAATYTPKAVVHSADRVPRHACGSGRLEYVGAAGESAQSDEMLRWQQRKARRKGAARRGRQRKSSSSTCPLHTAAAPCSGATTQASRRT